MGFKRLLAAIFEMKLAHCAVMLASLVAFLVSVFCQFILDEQPCELCLVSRFIHLVTAVVSAIAMKYANRNCVRCMVFLAVLFSFTAGIYHLGVENHWWAAPESCKTVLPTQEELANPALLLSKKNPNCDEVSLTIFGFSMTLLNFFLTAALFWFVSVCYALNYNRDNKTKISSLSYRRN
ncbi:MAG: disulfide bond formation protein B [Holosporales bacterium]|jgi:disulfide bond formation protein DsbB|nr:disulfide bond formation protein B [Holosporales bacterium]